MMVADWAGPLRIVLISNESPICHTLTYAKRLKHREQQLEVNVKTPL